MKQTRSIGIAATSGVRYAVCLNAWDLVALTSGDDERPLCAKGNNHRFHPPGDVLQAAAGFLLEQLSLVVVDRNVVSKAQELCQRLGREHRQALPRGEQERNAELLALARVLQHAQLAVWSDDSQARLQLLPDMVFVRIAHRPGMEGGDLVVVEIGGDESLRGELPWNALEQRGSDAECTEAIEIWLDILADRAHDQRAFAKQPQVVADVSRSAAVLPPHLRRKEAHVKDVKLVGEQMIPEAIRKYHDGVVRDRARDQDFHEG